MKILVSYYLFLLLVSVSCAPSEKSRELTMDSSDARFRSQYHFTPPAHWMNDPNGLVYYDEEFHLFYQHYPDSNVWGPMHWGHAVSTDMIAWEHLPIALYPDDHGYIFSGSAVIDLENTSGLGSAENPAMVAVFTYHNAGLRAEKRKDFQTQGIAYSLDKGRTFTKYPQNPVLPNPGIKDFRDPKVTWSEDYQKWIMILAVGDHVNIYSSPNLIDWIAESEFGYQLGAHGGVWECPDLFPMVDNQGTKQWVMLVSINPGGPLGGSATQYFVGDFDGSTFTPVDTTTRWIDHGTDNYAGVTWSNIPKTDGRRLFLGWMSNWQYANEVPTYEWRSAMTLPRELTLQNTPRGWEVHSRPVVELQNYFKDTIAFEGNTEISQASFMLDLKVDEIFTITLSNDQGDQVLISNSKDQFVFDRTSSGIVDFEEGFGVKHQIDFSNMKIYNVKVFVDRASVEVFINNGERVLTGIVFPNEPFNKVSTSGSVTSSDIVTIRSSMTDMN